MFPIRKLINTMGMENIESLDEENLPLQPITKVKLIRESDIILSETF